MRREDKESWEEKSLHTDKVSKKTDTVMKE